MFCKLCQSPAATRKQEQVLVLSCDVLNGRCEEKSEPWAAQTWWSLALFSDLQCELGYERGIKN